MKGKIKKLFALCLAFVLCLSTVDITYAQDDLTVGNAAEEVSDTLDDNGKTDAIADPDTSGAADEEEVGNDQEPDPAEDVGTVNEEGTDISDENAEQSVNSADGYSTEESQISVNGAEDNGNEISDAEESVSAPQISYRVHAQDYGWMDYETSGSGDYAGTVGEDKRVEAIEVRLSDAEGLSGDIYYRVHVQDYGWMDYVKSGSDEYAGTVGKEKRVEAVQMYLTGELAEKYDIYYSVHIQSYGWLQWAKGSTEESGICGSTGMDLRVEALEIRLVKKGDPAPDNGAAHSYMTVYSLGTVMYSGHQQNLGDLDAVYDGATLGVTGRSERLESLTVEKGEELRKLDGDIIYRVHVQDYGTQDWVNSGEIAGTEGKSKRLEAMQMALTGELAEKYDIYYRVHIRDIGWLKWTKGTTEESGWTGSSGYGLRCEAIQIQVIPKGNTAPTDNARYGYITENDISDVSYSGHQQSYGNLSAVTNGAVLGHVGESLRLEALNISLSEKEGAQVDGGIQYRAHVQDIGWQSWVADGEMSGTIGRSKRLEAIQIKLTGRIADFCDVWYRVHTQEYGWLGWAKNGQTAGTSGIGYRLEAVQIKIVPRYQPAPGANSGYYKDTPKMSAVDQRIYNYCQSVYNSVGRDLRSCYNWVVNNMRYQSLGVPSLPSGYTSRSQWYAIKAFSEHRGNCYCYAAAFYYLAKNLGYNAEYVEGRVTAAGGGYTPHGWVVINGAYICDPEAQDEIGRYNFYMQPIGSPVLSYIR